MASVGLVSPRSTCESIGALTPLRSARSRSDRPSAARSAWTRRPTGGMPLTSVVSVAIRVRYHVRSSVEGRRVAGSALAGGGSEPAWRSRGRRYTRHAMRRLVLLAAVGVLVAAPAARAAPDPLRPQQWG